MKKDKTYHVEVDVKWVQVLDATSKAEAIEKTKNVFEEEFGFRPTDDEIKLVEEQP